MEQKVIKVEDLGKCYRIRSSGQKSYVSLREEVSNKATKLIDVFRKGKTLGRSAAKKEDFWALENISFEVNRGEVLGIIGRNGAGKSTLLKLLGRITEPSKGKIKIKGQIASLLEVGTGFHPELTGRENIFLSGAILGMKRQDVKRYFDEIVQFAGVEQFLDTPVKRYSSGMFVRLGFAIAAHLQADILLVDEVLAVGDLEFQKRCLGKIGEVARNGRTILFVSHNLGAIEQLCDSCIVLDKGNIHFKGNISEALDKYMLLNSHEGNKGIYSFEEKTIRKISLSSEGKKSSSIRYGKPLIIEVEVHLREKIELPVLGIVIRDSYNVPVIGINNRHYGKYFDNVPLKKGVVSISIPSLPLVPGVYSIDFFLGDIHMDFEILENAISFIVESDKDSFLSSKLETRLNRVLIKDIDWQILSHEE